MISGCREKHEGKGAQTPRLRAPVDTPGETGVGIPDGRKLEAGAGAGPGSGGVTGNTGNTERHEDEMAKDVGLCRGV